jgi:hypothetical protein
MHRIPEWLRVVLFAAFILTLMVATRFNEAAGRRAADQALAKQAQAGCMVSTASRVAVATKEAATVLVERALARTPGEEARGRHRLAAAVGARAVRELLILSGHPPWTGLNMRQIAHIRVRSPDTRRRRIRYCERTFPDGSRVRFNA